MDAKAAPAERSSDGALAFFGYLECDGLTSLCLFPGESSPRSESAVQPAHSKAKAASRYACRRSPYGSGAFTDYP